MRLALGDFIGIFIKTRIHALVFENVLFTRIENYLYSTVLYRTLREESSIGSEYIR